MGDIFDEAAKDAPKTAVVQPVKPYGDSSTRQPKERPRSANTPRGTPLTGNSLSSLQKPAIGLERAVIACVCGRGHRPDDVSHETEKHPRDSVGTETGDVSSNLLRHSNVSDRPMPEATSSRGG